MKAVTRETFENRVEITHGKDKFDLSEFVLKGVDTKGQVKCKVCGFVFMISPYQLTNRRGGCKKCWHRDMQVNRSLSWGEFLRRSKETWGDKIWDYSETEYTSILRVERIICPKHGPFNQCLSSHLKGMIGCKECLKDHFKEKWDKTTLQILEKSKEFNNFSEFRKSSIYTIAHGHGVVKDIQKLLPSTGGDKYRRCIYAYEFEDNHVYVGLTYNMEERRKARFKTNSRDSAFLYLKETGVSYQVKQLTEYISAQEARLEENNFIESYRSKGWVILNKNSGGGLGGFGLQWTEEKCQEAVNKVKTFKELREQNKSAYSSIIRNGWHYMLSTLVRDRAWIEKKVRKVRCITTNVVYSSLREASLASGILAPTIRNCAIKGAKNRSTQTYWEFVNE